MTPLAAITLSKLVPFAIFGLFAVGAWLILETLGARKPRAHERLDELRNPRRRHESEAVRGKKNAAMGKVLAKASPMAKPLQPKSDEAMGKLKLRLSVAGFRHETAVAIFLGLKFIGLVVGLVLSGGTALFTAGLTQNALIYTVITTAATALKKLRRKHKPLQLAHPDRVRELIQRDPERFEKKLRPLLS